jgi:hypothetical protein
VYRKNNRAPIERLRLAPVKKNSTQVLFVFVVRDIFCAVAQKIPRPWLAVRPTGLTSLRLAPVKKNSTQVLIVFVVRDIFCAVAQKIPRPWLAVRPTGLTSLRLAPVKKNSTQVLFFIQVRALGFEPRTFRVSVECSTN